VRYIVQKAPGVGGDPIPDDEPCLVVRGQDVLAVDMLTTYIARYNSLGHDADPEVLEEMMRNREQLIQWQKDNPEKVKVADR
jgi:hypothetical protein